MKLLALTGLPRSGKDTIADHLVKQHGYVRVAFADPLKEAAAILLNRSIDDCHGRHGYDREQMMPEWGFSMRWFLQIFGTECLRQQVHPDFWIKRMEILLTAEVAHRDEANLNPDFKVVITDCRFENEAAMIREKGGTIVEVRRNGLTGSQHVSDKGVTLTLDDLIVPNNGTLQELYALIDNLAACYDW